MGNPNPVQSHNLNPNQNIQMISTNKLREPYINIITRGGVATGAYQNTQPGQMQVRPAAQNKSPLDVQKEKEVFLDARPKFVDTNKALTSGQIKVMPEIFEQLLRKQPLKKVSKLKEFFKSYLSLINVKDAFAE